MFENSTLFNYGRISADAGDGVYFIGDNGKIVNQLGAHITGYYNGIFAYGGNNVRIVNFGKISSFTEGVNLGKFLSNAELINHGSIYGHAAGVDVYNRFGESIIANFATITSDQVGMTVESNIGLTTLITNGAKGIIKGVTDAIETENAGAIKLVNHGTIIGKIDCTVAGANDVIINHGKIEGIVELGGNDLFNGRGGTSRAIFAEGGNDRIIAGRGNVAIHAGTGSDMLTAGPGHDKFFFDDALAGQVETITNFKHGIDKIVLLAPDFAGVEAVGGTLAAADFHIGAHAATVSQYIIYNVHTGFLFYDPHDGSPQTHFATLSPHLTLTHSDFFVAA
jgi:Ca2+-binding RTX toxin-like protein